MSYYRRSLKYPWYELRMMVAEWLFSTAALHIAPARHPHAKHMLFALQDYLAEVTGVEARNR